MLGLTGVISGVLLTFWPEREARAVKARMESGEDSYFEEQRAYAAYPSLRDPKRIRVRGLIVLVAGALTLADALLRHH